jgi:hypothetical protein
MKIVLVSINIPRSVNARRAPGDGYLAAVTPPPLSLRNPQEMSCGRDKPSAGKCAHQRI